jgi:hypothetical protein
MKRLAQLAQEGYLGLAFLACVFGLGQARREIEYRKRHRKAGR